MTPNQTTQLQEQIDELKLTIRVLRNDYEQKVKQLEESIYRATVMIQDLSIRLNDHKKEFDAHVEPVRLDVPEEKEFGPEEYH